MSRWLGRTTWIAALAALALTGALPAEGQTPAADLYRAGLRSFEFGYWREALVFFAAAAEEEPQEGRTVREYGMWQAPYLPHYYQGLALYQLGHYHEALRALETSEAQGAIRIRRSKKYYKKLIASKAAIRREISQQVHQVYRSAAADYETAEQLRESPAFTGSYLPTSIPAYGAITASLEKTTANLKDASLQAAASELGKALSLLDEARDGIAEMALEIRRRELEAIAAQNHRADQQRAAKLRADVELANTLLASGQCRPQAIELLESHDSTPRTAGEAGDTDQALNSLRARAHLQCDQLALAAHYLAAAEAHGESGWQTLQQELGKRQRSVERTSAFGAAVEQVAADRCDHQGIKTLEDLKEDTWTPEDTNGPNVGNLLVEAHLDCGEIDLAAAVLDRLRAAAVQSLDHLTKLRRTVEAARQSASSATGHAALRARYQQATAQLAGGDCNPQAIGLVHRLTLGHSQIGLTAGDLAAARSAVLGGLHCDDLATAESALAAVEPTSKSPEERAEIEEKLAQLQQHRRDRKGREQAVEDYLAARARTELGECRDQEVSTLIENAERALNSSTANPAGGQSTGASLSRSGDGLPVNYQPHLVLARAYSQCRDRDRVERYLELAGGSGEASPDELAELESWLAKHPKLEPYTGSFALLVGASNYGPSQGWPTLYQPGEDIREVRRILESHDFQVEVLENPTGRELETTLNQFFLRYGATESHRLVFYYAGHGHTEITRHGVKLGYLVPVDARDPKHDRTHLQDLFGMERFREYAIRSDANDILFMFDSCFAGTVFKATKSCAPPLCSPPTLANTSLGELISRPVRMFLTAGDEAERVPDNSLFRRMVTRALGGDADHDDDGFILGSELASFVQSEVISQQNEAIAHYKTAALGPAPAEPKWGTLIEGNFGLGDLLFDVPEGATSRQPRPIDRQGGANSTELAYWSAARQVDQPEDYRRYLERFPQGLFAPLAQWILERGTRY